MSGILKFTFPARSRVGRGKARRAGAAAVEFAIVAPLFFLFLIGIIEMGRMLMVYNLLTNASREAARIAIVEGASNQEVEEVARSFGGVSNKEAVAVDISPIPSTAAPGVAITVTLTVPFSEVSWIPPWFIPDYDVIVSTTMRKEGYTASDYQ